MVRDAGGRVHAVQIDLATPGAADQLMAVAAEHLDGLDILVNNAALDFGTGSLIADTDEQLWDDTMIVNAKSAFLTTRHAARNMRDGGRIINISSANTIRPAPGNAPYAASKGAIDTDLLRHANPEAALVQVAGMTPLGRLGQPDDIADVVALLASHQGRWLTGQVIHATGGLA